MNLSRKVILVLAGLLCSFSWSAGESPPLAKEALGAQVITLDGPDWLFAVDRKGTGRQEKWWTAPTGDAKPSKVPGIIQDANSGVNWHGVAWYWRDVQAPANPHTDGRFLLRFWNVCYKADVWVNEVYVGGHEGADGVFVLDVTKAIKVNGANRISVRVVDPIVETVGPGRSGTDGIVRGQIPGGHTGGQGGILDSVDLLVTAAVRVEDLFVRPDPKNGVINIAANLRNAGQAVDGLLSLVISPASGGESLKSMEISQHLATGDTLVTAQIVLANPRLWQLNDPYLYRVTARVCAEGSKSFDEQSAQCGFRDFRVEKGYFRLNGKRLFIRSTHTGGGGPLNLQVPYGNEDWLRRDLINLKVMGFNMVRIFQHAPQRYELDMCDEIGLLAYDEPRGGWLYENSPQMEERYDRSLTELIHRDRNHPSIVIWGLLNETPTPGAAENDAIFPMVVQKLPLVRSFDDSRLILLSSGRWDCRLDIGSVSNPGSTEWQCLLGNEGPGRVGKMSSTSIPSTNGWLTAYVEGTGDAHIYPRVPHLASTIDFLRTAGQGGKGVFVSEYGIGSAIDLEQLMRNYEQRGGESSPEAKKCRQWLDKFMSECWNKWHLEDTFGRPEDYFRLCVAKMAALRLQGLNALRSNPNVIGHSMTSMADGGLAGEGISATFRELKPGTVDAIAEGWAPLRWCLFTEPLNSYTGKVVKLEAVLANEDVLAPGDYPVRLDVYGANGDRVYERRTVVKIADPNGPSEPRFALPVFKEETTANWPAGDYRFEATLEHGGSAAGGAAEFHLADPSQMPGVESEVALWGDDPDLAGWLNDHGIRSHPFAPQSAQREVILVSSKAASPGDAQAFRQLVEGIARGSTAIFLSPKVFAKGAQPLGWLPLEKKGKIETIWSWVYLKDEWAKRHPIFDGLPSGGLMDYNFYREIIPDYAYYGQDDPMEAVSGAAQVSYDFFSGLMVSTYALGDGRFILNTLRIQENLGKDPVAERLLRNMLRFAANNNNKPSSPLPANFDLTLKAIGYLQ